MDTEARTGPGTGPPPWEMGVQWWERWGAGAVQQDGASFWAGGASLKHREQDRSSFMQKACGSQQGRPHPGWARSTFCCPGTLEVKWQRDPKCRGLGDGELGRGAGTSGKPEHRSRVRAGPLPTPRFPWAGHEAAAPRSPWPGCVLRATFPGGLSARTPGLAPPALPSIVLFPERLSPPQVYPSGKAGARPSSPERPHFTIALIARICLHLKLREAEDKCPLGPALVAWPKVAPQWAARFCHVVCFLGNSSLRPHSCRRQRCVEPGPCFYGPGPRVCEQSGLCPLPLRHTVHRLLFRKP